MTRYTVKMLSLRLGWRWLALALLLPVLSSCVTYYYPATEQADGVYYASEDPVYAPAAVDYVGVSYYPWWSVDYFYLGYGYYGSGVSVGLSYGYPAWPGHYRGWYAYPYGYSAWYYDPWRVGWWYGPPRHYAWYGYYNHYAHWHVYNRHHRYRYDHYDHYDRGRDRYDRRHDGRYNGRDHGRDARDRYARGDTRSRRNDSVDYGERHYRATGHGRNEIGSWDGDGSTQRHVSVAPGANARDRGMVVVNRDGGKWSRSRTEPVGSPRPVKGDRSVEPVSRVGSGRSYQVTRNEGTTVRRSASPKISRSRTTPVSDPVRVGVSGGSRSAESSPGAASYGRPPSVSADRGRANGARAVSPASVRPPVSAGKPPSSRNVKPARAPMVRPSRGDGGESSRARLSSKSRSKRDR